MDIISNDKSEYNEIPVSYCKKCLSLNIRHISTITGSNYCDSCGSTDIGESHIDEWDKLYVIKYGHKYLDNNY